jgi:hypothetical protein
LTDGGLTNGKFDSAGKLFIAGATGSENNRVVRAFRSTGAGSKVPVPSSANWEQERTLRKSTLARHASLALALATLARSASKGHKVGSTMRLRQH